METAGISLVKGDLRGIAKARRLSQRTMNNIRQNLFFCVCLQHLGRSTCRWSFVPGISPALESNDRSGSYEPQVGFCDR